MKQTRLGKLWDQYERGWRDGKAGENNPPHGFWRSLVRRLGLLTRSESAAQRLSNNAYQAGRKDARDQRD